LTSRALSRFMSDAPTDLAVGSYRPNLTPGDTESQPPSTTGKAMETAGIEPASAIA
jgi:hypothetical protein